MNLGDKMHVLQTRNPELWKSNKLYYQKLLKERKLEDRERNDYGVTLIYLGQIEEGLEILKALEASRPGVYETASNIGTAYELLGDNERALQWIKTGIERNPDSHEGTEWLHVRILEAKIAAEKDPSWFSSNKVLKLDFGGEMLPKLKDANVKDHLGTKRTASDIRKALYYQLAERMKFVAAPNAAVGQLLDDYANLKMLAEMPVLEDIIPIYELANSYHQNAMTTKRIAHFKKLVAANSLSMQRTTEDGTPSHEFGNNAGIWIAAIVGALLVLSGMTFAYMRSKSTSDDKQI